MKSLKIVVASLLLAIGTLTVSSFTVKEFKSNAFAIKCYEYSLVTQFDLLNPGLTDFVQETPFKTSTNWVEKVGADPETDCGGTPQVCLICFDESLLSTFTKGQIADELRKRIVALNTTPTQGQIYNLSIGGTNFSVQVYLEPNS